MYLSDDSIMCLFVCGFYEYNLNQIMEVISVNFFISYLQFGGAFDMTG